MSYSAQDRWMPCGCPARPERSTRARGSRVQAGRGPRAATSGQAAAATHAPGRPRTDYPVHTSFNPGAHPNMRLDRGGRERAPACRTDHHRRPTSRSSAGTQAGTGPLRRACQQPRRCDTEDGCPPDGHTPTRQLQRPTVTVGHAPLPRQRRTAPAVTGWRDSFIVNATLRLFAFRSCSPQHPRREPRPAPLEQLALPTAPRMPADDRRQPWNSICASGTTTTGPWSLSAGRSTWPPARSSGPR